MTKLERSSVGATERESIKNGRQVYLDHFGYTDWASLPIALSEIRQIEVVRGPNSAIFGFNAVSGVVNIITFNPKFDDTNVIELRAGTGESTSVSAVKTVRLGERLSFRISGGVDHANEWKNTTSGAGIVLASQIHNPSTARANLDAMAQLNDKTTLRVEGSMSNGTSRSRASLVLSCTENCRPTVGTRLLTSMTLS